jgi:hypothetical protein
LLEIDDRFGRCGRDGAKPKRFPEVEVCRVAVTARVSQSLWKQVEEEVLQFVMVLSEVNKSNYHY